MNFLLYWGLIGSMFFCLVVLAVCLFGAFLIVRFTRPSSVLRPPASLTKLNRNLLQKL